ncbi:MAG: hypoxia induced protein conserved region-domain-containing protein, partial [Piptocephalis tieghemiana]
TILGRLKRRCMQEPWVPIGGIATVGALFAATLQMRRGNLVSANHLLRLRVATQGLTVTAMLLGSYLALDKKRKES